MALIPGAFATSAGAVILGGGGGGGGGATPSWAATLDIDPSAQGRVPVVDNGLELQEQAAQPTPGASRGALWSDAGMVGVGSLEFVSDAGVSYNILSDLRIDTTIAPAPPNPLIHTLTPGIAPILFDAAGAVTHQITFPASNTMADGALVAIFFVSGFATDTISLIPGAGTDVIVGLDNIGGAAGSPVTIPPGTIPPGAIVGLWRMSLSGAQPTWVFVGYSASPLSGGGGTPGWNDTLAQDAQAQTVDPVLVEPRRMILGQGDYGSSGVLQDRVYRTTRTQRWTSVGGSPPPFQTIGSAILPDIEMLTRNYVILSANGVGGAQSGGAGPLFAQDFYVEEMWQDGNRLRILRREGLGALPINSPGEVAFARTGNGYELQIRGDASAGLEQYVIADVSVLMLGGPDS